MTLNVQWWVFFRIEIIVIKIIEAHGQYVSVVLASGVSYVIGKNTTLFNMQYR